ncbi:MAG TPA: cobalamin biosynthesis protein [Rhodobacteraceae bacterium]|nr:cobalamin biosynthesis protein [Paracoccaceae bacterium]
MNHALVLFLAMLLDAWVGEPRWLWSRVAHPAVLMGRAIEALERRLNHGPHRFRAGLVSLAILVAAAALTGWLVPRLPLGALWETLLVAILLAQKSLVDHVGAVARALGLSPGDARMVVARIVGRDTRDLDPPAIARAAIESAAENLSDAVVAPVFWFLLAGLPGLLVYKVTNTADSMIGYRSERFEAFGKAAARLDDLLNWLPARLTALLIALVSWRPGMLAVIRRDAPLHRSPNAGWPEAAMAVALGVALSGPRAYAGQRQAFPWVNQAGRQDTGADDILAATRVLWKVWLVLLGAVALIAVA